MKKHLIAAALIFLPCLAFADITFDGNGKWETSFDYSETCYHNRDSETPSCVGIADDGVNWSYGGKETVSGDVDLPTTATVAANNPLGTGMGSRHWIGDGSNSVSNKNTIFFPSPQTEFWTRWYIRYQEGFRWSSYTYDKMFYVRGSGVGDVLWSFGGSGLFVVYANGAYLYSEVSWSDIFGTTSHGNFVPFEVYLKVNTAGASNGIARMWINGTLVVEATNVNFGATPTGYDSLSFHENQSSPSNAGGTIGSWVAYVDYDDIAIYNQTPPNTDADGNAFIGTLGETPSPTISAPSGFRTGGGSRWGAAGP